MQAVGIIRKLDKLGRVVVPIELRERLNIDAEEGTKLEIFVDKQNETIVMKKYERGCDFCGEMNNNVEYKGKKICESCAEELYDKAEGKEELF